MNFLNQIAGEALYGRIPGVGAALSTLLFVTAVGNFDMLNRIAC
jgi:hypothetical protein